MMKGRHGTKQLQTVWPNWDVFDHACTSCTPINVLQLLHVHVHVHVYHVLYASKTGFCAIVGVQLLLVGRTCTYWVVASLSLSSLDKITNRHTKASYHMDLYIWRRSTHPGAFISRADNVVKGKWVVETLSIRYVEVSGIDAVINSNEYPALTCINHWIMLRIEILEDQ